MLLPQSYQYLNLSEGADRIIVPNMLLASEDIKQKQNELTASVDSCAEIKSTPSVAQPSLAEFGGRCRKAMIRVWVLIRVWKQPSAESRFGLAVRR